MMDTTIWNKNPDDGVLCLLSTRRVLDEYGFCCDYNRCPVLHVLQYGSGRVDRDRCIYDVGHEGRHHGSRCGYWA